MIYAPGTRNPRAGPQRNLVWTATPVISESFWSLIVLCWRITYLLCFVKKNIITTIIITKGSTDYLQCYTLESICATVIKCGSVSFVC